MASDNAVVREGVSAGLIGATAIAVWFGVLDAIEGHVFDTPIMLGGALGSLFLKGALPSPAAAFLVYTVFHFGMFCLTGILFSWVVNQAEKVPSALIGFAGLFVAFEVGWVGWTSVLSQGFGTLTWLQVLVANLIASAAMGFYMWRQHPSLGPRVSAALAGTPE